MYNKVNICNCEYFYTFYLQKLIKRMDKTKMTKDDYKKELELTKIQLAELEKEKTELARCFSAVTVVRTFINEQLDALSAGTEAEDMHNSILNEGKLEILNNLFVFSANGECEGFNLDTADYYRWLAADPRRKKAAPL